MTEGEFEDALLSMGVGSSRAAGSFVVLRQQRFMWLVVGSGTTIPFDSSWQAAQFLAVASAAAQGG